MDTKPASSEADLAAKPGHALQGPHREARPVETPVDFVPLRLLLLPGGLSVELSRPDMLVGRHSEADVRLALPDISRRHCRFLFQHGHWKVIDLNSLNGVYVNGQRMHEATVYDGDKIRLGGFTFAVRIQGTAAVDASLKKSVEGSPDQPAPQRKAS
jgi:pSer/pThr/pTyr-binding forkhead associated (FHA) protein